MIWFTSDTHFGHANIIKHCNRPFRDVHIMDAYLIAYWNQLVRPGDTIYHLGDFAFATKDRVTDILSKLNGRKILIAGNHDPSHTRKNEGWYDAVPWRFIDIDGVNSLMVHNPAQAPDLAEPTLVLHGHQHGSTTLHDFKPAPGYFYVDVGVDAGWAYIPVSLDQIIERKRLLGAS